MAVIVDSDAVVNPWTVASTGLAKANMLSTFHNLLVMLCDAPITPATMLASQRHADHTMDTKVVFVKPPLAQKGFYYSLLLSKPTQLRHITWLIEHGAEVKVATKEV